MAQAVQEYSFNTGAICSCITDNYIYFCCGLIYVSLLLIEKLCKIKPPFKNYGMLGQRDSAAGKVLALCVTDMGWITSTLYGPRKPTRSKP